MRRSSQPWETPEGECSKQKNSRYKGPEAVLEGQRKAPVSGGWWGKGEGLAGRLESWARASVFILILASMPDRPSILG